MLNKSSIIVSLVIALLGVFAGLYVAVNAREQLDEMTARQQSMAVDGVADAEETLAGEPVMVADEPEAVVDEPLPVTDELIPVDVTMAGEPEPAEVEMPGEKESAPAIDSLERTVPVAIGDSVATDSVAS